MRLLECLVLPVPVGFKWNKYWVSMAGVWSLCLFVFVPHVTLKVSIFRWAVLQKPQVGCALFRMPVTLINFFFPDLCTWVILFHHRDWNVTQQHSVQREGWQDGAIDHSSAGCQHRLKEIEEIPRSCGKWPFLVSFCVNILEFRGSKIAHFKIWMRETLSVYFFV